MSRPSFRPRPIDLAKPLPIIKSSKDLRNEDDVVVNRALPTIATGVDPAEEEEQHLKQALLASVLGEVDIPIPVCHQVEPPKMPQRGGPFKRPPAAYIVFDRSDDDIEHATIDYDADFEDEAFVTKFNKDHPLPEKTKQIPFNIGLMEKAMDVLEKAQGRSENEDKNLVTYATVRASLSDAIPTFSDLCRRQVFAHWSGRRTRHPASFLRFYQKQPAAQDPNPAVAFRPRDKDANLAGRRMNTYENFLRATALRKELDELRSILRYVVSRDRIKLELSSVNVLQSRLGILRNGGPRLDVAARRALHASRDRVVLVGDAPNQTALPARDLFLPTSYVLQELPADGFGVEKIKRTVRKTGRDGKRLSEPPAGGRARSALGSPVGVDAFGFEDHATRFLKHMRYFAGGFMNYGVNPYDHRVFTAASERNTVRDLPRSPAPVALPGPAVAFAELPAERDERVKKAEEAFKPPTAVGARKGGKTGFKGSRDPAAAAALAKALPKEGLTAPTPKRRRTMRVRGRVGRGGRIIFDRVSYERERGVKAASYPSSVEMGGVYTAGIPFEAASRVLRSAATGGLGDVSLLQPRGLADEGATTPAEGEEDVFTSLVKPLEPVSHISKGVPTASGEMDYWPHRRTRAVRYPLTVKEDAGVVKTKKKTGFFGSLKERLRELPAFKRVLEPLVVEVEPEKAAMM